MSTKTKATKALKATKAPPKNSSVVDIALFNIQNAEAIRKELLRQDPLADFYIYDKNECMRTAFATQNGVATGTCAPENAQHAVDLVRTGQLKASDVQLVHFTFENSAGNIINHFAILVKTNSGAIRYICHSNGMHKNVLWSMKHAAQTPLSMKPIVLVGNFFENDVSKEIAISWLADEWINFKKRY
jgi:hypothetical protein